MLPSLPFLGPTPVLFVTASLLLHIFSQLVLLRSLLVLFFFWGGSFLTQLVIVSHFKLMPVRIKMCMEKEKVNNGSNGLRGLIISKK